MLSWAIFVPAYTHISGCGLACWTLPITRTGHVWETLVDTRDAEGGPLRVCRGGEKYPLFGRSLALLRTNIPEAAGSAASPAQMENLRKDARRTPAPASTTGPLTP